MALELYACGQRLLRRKAQAVHAGVDLEHYIEARATRRCIQHAQLIVAVYCDGQVMRGRRFDFRDIEQPLEQHEPPAITAIAQRNSRVDFQQCDAVRATERPRRARDAVPISIGLDDREYTRMRCAAAHDAKIVAQCSEVDARLDRAHLVLLYRHLAHFRGGEFDECRQEA